jgi:NADH-quinone oxidoreductase subunit E
MLSPEERREIEAEFPRYPTKQALSIDAMRIVQKHRGWVSDEALEDISELLGMSRSDLDGVATFYNLIFRRPVGKHVIYFCDSVSCWIMGCRSLGAQLSARRRWANPGAHAGSRPNRAGRCNEGGRNARRATVRFG